MFDFEDTVSIESHRIPWLIWIQILIFFLLLLLFYSFSLFTCSDLSSNNLISSASTSSSPSISYSSKAIFNNQKHRNNSTTVANLLQHHNQVGGSQSIKGEIATSTSRAIVREDDISQGFSASSIIGFHPCNYFRLAKLAFLKCFGLDPTTDNYSNSDRRKER